LIGLDDKGAIVLREKIAPRDVGVLPRHVALDRHGATRRIDCVSELDQQAVPAGLVRNPAVLATRVVN